MNLRHTLKGRKALTAVAITAGLVLTVSGCGDGGDDAKGEKPTSSSAPTKNEGGGKSKEPQTSAAEPALTEVKGGGLTLTITSAKRDQGGFLTVEGTVTNGTGSAWAGAEWRGDEKELAKNGGSIAGASLIDQTGKKRYLVLRDTEGRCLCTRFDGGIRSGETIEWFAQFPAPPEGTSKVDFQVGAMPPASIELSEGE